MGVLIAMTPSLEGVKGMGLSIFERRADRLSILIRNWSVGNGNDEKKKKAPRKK